MHANAMQASGGGGEDDIRACLVELEQASELFLAVWTRGRVEEEIELFSCSPNSIHFSPVPHTHDNPRFGHTKLAPNHFLNLFQISIMSRWYQISHQTQRVYMTIKLTSNLNSLICVNMVHQTINQVLKYP
jgi:hypothetical protein